MSELTGPELDFLHHAIDLAREGGAGELAALVDAGLPVNLTNPAGDTLLILAAYHEHPDTVAALLQRGADTERQNDRGQTALGAAAFRRQARQRQAAAGRRRRSQGRCEERPGPRPLLRARRHGRAARGATAMSPSLSLGDVMAARGRIEGSVRRTPVAEVDPAALGLGGGPDPLWLKLELLQHAGSFKARGAFNRVLSARDAGQLPAAGVVAASGGNAGLAIAYAAGVVGVPAEIHVPTTAPAVKVARLAALGARVVQEGTEYAHAQESALTARRRAGRCSATPTTSRRSAPVRAPSGSSWRSRCRTSTPSSSPSAAAG